MAYPFNLKNGGAYCDMEAVRGMFKNIEGYSKLDAKEFDIRIVEAATEIDATLGVLYVTPITGGVTTLALLRLINARLAAAMIYEVFFTASNPNESPAAQSYRNFAEMIMLDLVQGNMQLFDAIANQEKPMYPKGHGAKLSSTLDTSPLYTEDQPMFRRLGTRHLAHRQGDLM